jgi:hypothetical protein
LEQDRSIKLSQIIYDSKDLFKSKIGTDWIVS